MMNGLRAAAGFAAVTVTSLCMVGMSCASQAPKNSPAQNVVVLSAPPQVSAPVSATVASASASVVMPVAPAPVARMCSEIPSLTPLAKPAVAAAAAPPAYQPGTIRCGKRSCNLNQQICCSNTTKTACGGRVVPRPATSALFDSTARFEPQQNACKRVGVVLEGMPPRLSLAYCDDSSDCPSGQVCCGTYRDNEAMLYTQTCEPLPADGTSPCPDHERCAEGQPCRLPGTVCGGGICANPEMPVACGKETCRGDTECCWRRSEQCVECASRGSCSGEDTYPFYCDDPHDCPAGERCQVPQLAGGLSRSSCGGESECEMGCPWLCKTTANCPPGLSCIINGSTRETVSFVPPGFGYCNTRP